MLLLLLLRLLLLLLLLLRLLLRLPEELVLPAPLVLLRVLVPFELPEPLVLLLLEPPELGFMLLLLEPLLLSDLLVLPAPLVLAPIRRERACKGGEPLTMARRAAPARNKATRAKRRRRGRQWRRTRAGDNFEARYLTARRIAISTMKLASNVATAAIIGIWT